MRHVPNRLGLLRRLWLRDEHDAPLRMPFVHRACPRPETAFGSRSVERRGHMLAEKEYAGALRAVPRRHGARRTLAAVRVTFEARAGRADLAGAHAGRARLRGEERAGGAELGASDPSRVAGEIRTPSVELAPAARVSGPASRPVGLVTSTILDLLVIPALYLRLGRAARKVDESCRVGCARRRVRTRADGDERTRTDAPPRTIAGDAGGQQRGLHGSAAGAVRRRPPASCPCARSRG